MTLVLMVVLVGAALAQEPSPCSPNPCGENTRCQVVLTMQTSIIFREGVYYHLLFAESANLNLLDYLRHYYKHSESKK